MSETNESVLYTEAPVPPVEVVAPIDYMLEARAKLYAALAKAQGSFPEIAKNRDVEITMKSGGKYRFRYADLQKIISATKGPLSDNGLCVIQTMTQEEDGKTYLTTRLAHEAGASVCSKCVLPGANEADPKGIGAMITYFRRYHYQSLVGVAADDDLDDNGVQVDADAVPEFIVEMTDKAKQGVEVYQKYWTTELNQTQRMERKALHEGMKRLAVQSDAERAKEPA